MVLRLVDLLLVMVGFFAVLICDGNAEEVVVTSAEKLSRITFSENCWATEISAGVQTQEGQICCNPRYRLHPAHADQTGRHTHGLVRAA